jgi:hypothetical protein
MGKKIIYLKANVKFYFSGEENYNYTERVNNIRIWRLKKI